MLQRRFAQARQEQDQLDRDEAGPVKWSILPDLIVIDGGKGQLSAAREVLFEYNVTVPAIALAKKQELIVTPDSVDPIALPQDSHALRLLQRVRDEAHRFANAYHQKLRERRVVYSVLEDIKGIGDKRKRDLIRRFGSVRHVREATVEQIAEVVGPKMAQKLVDYLREHPDVRFKDQAIR
jgi:excinuclease ABC subunit C